MTADTYDSVITVDADLRDLVPPYLAHRGEDLETATAALERGDFGVIGGIGHNMYGSGCSFGFDELTAIGRRLERAASAGDRVAIARLLGRLRVFLSRAEGALAAPAGLRSRAVRQSALARPDAAPVVLVVDDQEMNAAIVTRYLSREGYEVRHVASGDAALAELGSGPPPDLILLDVVMAGTGGLEVCRRIKSNAATCGIPVMMVTGRDSGADRVRIWAAGADEVMAKPVRRAELVSRVRALAKKNPQEQGSCGQCRLPRRGEGG